MDEKVLNFINHFTLNGKRREVIETFTNGCCYWFALLLSERFYQNYIVEIMYDEIANHFGCRIGYNIYDITGNVTNKYNWQSWISVVHADRTHAERIKRDCINWETKD